MPAPEVAVAVVAAGELPILLEYTGRAAGSRDVEVRARVSGILLERRYEEGSAVAKGDVLFRIDPEPYRAAAAQARAELGVANARFNEARRQRDRVVPLVEQKVASERQRDEVISAYEVAEANVAAAAARLRSADLDLSYTDVRAPISGLTSREARSEGSLVRAGDESSLLTTIVQTDPIYVEFTLPESEATLARKARDQDASGVRVKLLRDDADRREITGELGFIDTSVEQGSGTVRARATIANGNQQLVPGQFVRVRIEGISTKDTVSVPRRAVMTSAQGSFVWLVGADEVVELRPVRLAGTAADRALIGEGLKGGERVVVDGVLKVRPGVKVAIAKNAAPVQDAAAASSAATSEATAAGGAGG
jgi:membrane fusion protein (multidrug efflux system)